MSPASSSAATPTTVTPTSSSSVTVSTVSPTSTPPANQQTVRIPREAAFPENQPIPAAEPMKKVSDSFVPVAEPSRKTSSDKAVSDDELTKNHSNSVPVAEPQHNHTKSDWDIDSVSSGHQHLSNISNHIVVADAAESVQRVTKPDENIVVSDKEVVDKIIFENPFNKNQGQLLLDSTRRVTISLLLATNNTTSSYNLVTHGTVSAQFSSTTSLPTVSTTVSNSLESNSTNETITITDEESLSANLNKYFKNRKIIQDKFICAFFFRVWKPLTWYSGGDEIILDLPYKKRLSDFRWLSVYDHTNQVRYKLISSHQHVHILKWICFSNPSQHYYCRMVKGFLSQRH